MLPVIKVENVSKQYRLGAIGTGTINHDVNRWWNRMRGKEDPYLKIGEENNRTTKGSSDYVWALKDINFEVMPGEVLGIIGRNGAGKSTLLKILSRTTAPTTGRIRIHGRVASLLEVGTGFHPELSGRENVYLNGTILGMTKAEISRKFDEIVNFAGVERYIDTPVKRYSSGMYVRLAFAVAAHLEPDVLIVDEVLAVGDAEFQKKCLGKMKDVSVNEGRTILFVSHNMGAINNLCSKVILLTQGTIDREGLTSEVLDSYFFQSIQKSLEPLNSTNGELNITTIYFVDKKGFKKNVHLFGEPIIIRVHIVFKRRFGSITVGFALNDSNGNRVVTAHSIDDESFDAQNLDGEVTFECYLDIPFLAPGIYSYNIGVRDEREVNIISLKDYDTIEITSNGKKKDGTGGVIHNNGIWRTL